MSPWLAASSMSVTSRPAALACSTDFDALAQAYDDVDPGVLEVAGVRVALGAVAQDGHGLALEQVQVRVVVVIHGARS